MIKEIRKDIMHKSYQLQMQLLNISLMFMKTLMDIRKVWEDEDYDRTVYWDVLDNSNISFVQSDLGLIDESYLRYKF